MKIDAKKIKELQFWDMYEGGNPWWIDRKRQKVPGFEITNYEERMQKVKEIEDVITKFIHIQNTELELEGDNVLDGDHRMTAIKNLINKGVIKSINLNNIKYL